MRIGWTSLDDNCHCPSPSYPLTMNFANRRVSSVDVSGRAQKVVGVHLGQPEGTAVDVVATPQQLLHLFILFHWQSYCYIIGNHKSFILR